MSSCLSSVCVPDMVYGSSDVERLWNLVQTCDQAIFLETWSCHGRCGQQSKFQGKDFNWDSHKRGWDVFTVHGSIAKFYKAKTNIRLGTAHSLNLEEQWSGIIFWWLTLNIWWSQIIKKMTVELTTMFKNESLKNPIVTKLALKTGTLRKPHTSEANRESGFGLPGSINFRFWGSESCGLMSQDLSYVRVFLMTHEYSKISGFIRLILWIINS